MFGHKAAAWLKIEPKAPDKYLNNSASIYW